MRQKSFPTVILLPFIILFFSFTGCSKEKPAQPILLLTSRNNFGSYTGEILKAEGFNEFITDSLGSKKISKSFLAQFDQIILTEQVNDSRMWKMFMRYVRRGGNLIAFQPGQARIRACLALKRYPEISADPILPLILRPPKENLSPAKEFRFMELRRDIFSKTERQLPGSAVNQIQNMNFQPL